MLLIKSLLCWKGHDSRQRFFIISLTTFILFTLSSILFAPSFLLSVVSLLLSSYFYGASIQRRLHDGALQNNWLVILLASYLLIGLVISGINNLNIYWLLLIPAGLTLLLLTYPSDQKREYILGYYGPVDLHAFNRINNEKKRIEPTLTGELASKNATISEQANDMSLQHTTFSAQLSEEGLKNDIGELIRLGITSNRKVLFAVASIIMFIIMAVIINISFSTTEQVPPLTPSSPLAVTTYPESENESLNHPLEMSDGFTLYLSRYQGLSITWQANDTKPTVLWSQKSALGDKSCQEITFNNGNKVRTLNVTIEGSTLHKAQFSPLDTEEIITNLALRGHFSLCGYEFSLKGSQAKIAKNKHYANFMAY